ncbi:MAG: DMT family transporter [Alistipes sp.]|nr:DMT family transporter [Alistipes sp.]
MKSGELRAHIALIGCNIVWACDYPFYNLLLGRYIAPMAMVCLSLVVAAALSWVPRIWERGEKIESSDWGIIILSALLMGVARKTLMMFGMSRTSPIDGSIIATVVPLIVLVVSVAAGIDSFTRRRVLGLFLGMAGAVAVVLSGGTMHHIESELLGNVMILTSGVVTALYMVFFKRLVAKYRITTLLRVIYTLSALVVLPFGWSSVAEVHFAGFDTHIWLAALFVLIVPTYLPNLLLNYSLRYVQPTISSTYSYIQPILAVALSVAMGLDRLQADTILFAVILFVGVWLVISSYSLPKKIVRAD